MNPGRTFDWPLVRSPRSVVIIGCPEDDGILSKTGTRGIRCARWDYTLALVLLCKSVLDYQGTRTDEGILSDRIKGSCMHNIIAPFSQGQVFRTVTCNIGLRKNDQKGKGNGGAYTDAEFVAAFLFPISAISSRTCRDVCCLSY